MNEKETDRVIAVIDDDESVRRSLSRLLKAAGFQSAVFRSAEAFLADPQHPRFDCLIVDLQLGGMSGTDLQEQLKSAGVNIPMILMTAREEKELGRLALHLHGAALMRKSDPGEALLGTIRRMLHRRRHPENGPCDGGNV